MYIDISDILKVDFLRGQNFSLTFLCARNSAKLTQKNHIICVNHEEKKVKEVKMHKFLVCAYKYQDLAQSQENFARSHDRVTVTFRNSASRLF